MIVLFILLILLSSCSFSGYTTLTCHIADEHPYEQASGTSMWHRVVYFDGKDVKSFKLDAGVRTFKIHVRTGGLRPVVVIPLNKLSPIGGYYEDGCNTYVNLYSENGSFLNTLLDGAKVRADAVSSLSLEWLKSTGYDFGTIDQASFLESLFDGNLTQEKVKNSTYFHPKIDSISDGHWISDSVKADSFTIRGEDEIVLNLFAGVYNFWCVEKNLLLTVVIAEDGRMYTMMDALPELLR